MRRALPFVLAVAVAAIVVVGLVQAGGNGGDPPQARFDLEAALGRLQGSPAPLASLHSQAGQLLDGGVSAYRARLRELRGHPIVVNKWASWCGPCRVEFPVFQRVAAARGRTIAFLGIDSYDNRADARQFLAEYPVPYPSYVDPDEKIARAAGAPAGYPITLFIDERGETAFVHQGQYRTEAELEADIREYLGA